MGESDPNERYKEVIRQESFWFTATTLAFTGFVGALLRQPSMVDAILASSLIVVLTLFTIYLLVGRHKKYCELNNERLPNWWAALWRATKEMSGTLYCVMVVTFSAIGFILIILMRFIEQHSALIPAPNS
jgi:hypothetical protein